MASDSSLFNVRQIDSGVVFLECTSGQYPKGYVLEGVNNEQGFLSEQHSHTGTQLTLCYIQLDG